MYLLLVTIEKKVVVLDYGWKLIRKNHDFFRVRKKERGRRAADSLTYPVCKILPALHAFTSCDTTSKIGTKKL